MFGWAVCLAAPPASARVFLNVDEALALAFPECTIERKTIYLSDAQLMRARELARVPVESALLTRYEAHCKGQPGGVAYFDAHRVRTEPETLLIVVDPAGKVRRVEILSFDEPADYIPRPPWYAQFQGLELSDELALRRGIRGVAGASLTARATTEAVRRVLALHRVLAEPPAKAGAE